jgi:hypothetical protein
MKKELTIFKYTIGPENTNLFVPEGAQFLSVDFQGETLCLWAQVDKNCKKTIRKILVVPTGAPIDCLAEVEFIGTAFLKSESFVFHVFEVKEKS